MPTYQITIVRPMRFTIELDTATRLDALQIIHDVSMKYDRDNESKTTILSIREIKQTDVHNPVD
jgi:hypothetical protein